MAGASVSTAQPPSSRDRRRRPPGPIGHALFGSLPEIRNDPLRLFVQAADRYGDLVLFRAVHRRVYLVVGPDLIAHVAVANRENYKKGVSYDALRVPIRDSLLTADGSTAQSRRRL